jgi:short-subunit dehydrogenase
MKIVITGANSGIGMELLKIYSNENGHEIIAVDRNTNAIESLGGRSKIITIKTDLSNHQNNELLVNSILDSFGVPDLFIANAGFAYYEKIGKMEPDHIRNIFEVNVFSPIYCLSSFIHLNAKIHFVFVASAMAKVGMPGYALYASTKAAIDKFAECYELEKNENIKLSVVYPVSTKTNFFAASSGSIIPWPAQSAEKVAMSIYRGIKKGKSTIYPSRIFYLATVWGRIQKLLFQPYQWYYARRL